MTPREKTVIRAIVKALRRQGSDDMDAFSMSYESLPSPRGSLTIRQRSAYLLEALTNAD
jgi:hypothetical protein